MRSRSSSLILPSVYVPFVVSFAVISLAAAQQSADSFEGKVVAITDGDTVKVLVDKQQVTVRLEGIDAPESGQSFGTKSKEALAKLVAEKSVTVRKTGEDRYGRTLGIIIQDSTDVNAKMVEDGWAWHFKKYSKDLNLAKLEVAARAANKGLWADPNPLAPWDYRARKTPAGNSVKSDATVGPYWLNTSSGVRHNERCEHFSNTKKGRLCTSSEGKACGICGG